MLKKHWLGLEEQLWSVFFQHWTRVAVFIFAKQDQLFVFEYCFNFYNNGNLTSLRKEFKVQLVRVTSELKINGKTMVDYTEPENKQAFSNEFERKLAEGTFALQAHDPQSVVYFRNIEVKRLP